ncbi:MAG: RIO1 family regulatory kinase/ATPase [Pseudolysinimonas sp.]
MHSADQLIFSTVEPGDDQRWSTWPSITPTQRGPEPWPDWVVTSAGAIDTELGVVKTGKEADLHLIERFAPGLRASDPPRASTVLAAKRYRTLEHRDFHRSAEYQEGRRTRRSRDERAVAKGTAYGRSFAAGMWAFAEFEALSTLHRMGASVPYPVQVDGTELLMEFIGHGTSAAPRLAQTRAEPAELRELFDQVVDAMRLFAQAGLVHGDLSAYNLLVHEGRVVVIDLPQIVDTVSNPNGIGMLHRDCVNIADWFTRKRVPVDAETLFADLLGELF